VGWAVDGAGTGGTRFDKVNSKAIDALDDCLLGAFVIVEPVAPATARASTGTSSTAIICRLALITDPSSFASFILALNSKANSSTVVAGFSPG